MIEERGAENAVDALDAEAFGELAQGDGDGRQVLDGPVAEREGVDPRLLDLGVLTAGKRALHVAELRQAKLLGELRVERDLRTAGVDEEGDLVTAIDAYTDQGQRIGLEEFHARELTIALHP